MAFLSGAIGADQGRVQKQKDDLATSQNDRDYAEKVREFNVGQAEDTKRNDAYVSSITAGNTLKSAQAQKVLTDISQMTDPQAIGYIQRLAAIGQLDAKTAEILLGTIPKDQAQTKLIGAQTSKILQGEIPLLKSQKAYEDHKIAYDDRVLQEKYVSLDAATQKEAAALAGRIRVAGLSNAGRLAVASMMAATGLYKNDENNALKIALDQYQNEFKSYLQQSNPKYADPDNPHQPQQPTLDPTTAALLAGILRGNNGQPQQSDVPAILNFLKNFMPQQPGANPTNNGQPPLTPEETQAKAYAQQAAAAGKDPAKIKDLVTKAARAVGNRADQKAVLAELKRQLDLLPGRGAVPQMPIGSGAPVIQGISPALLSR